MAFRVSGDSERFLQLKTFCSEMHFLLGGLFDSQFNLITYKKDENSRSYLHVLTQGKVDPFLYPMDLWVPWPFCGALMH